MFRIRVDPFHFRLSDPALSKTSQSFIEKISNYKNEIKVYIFSILGRIRSRIRSRIKTDPKHCFVYEKFNNFSKSHVNFEDRCTSLPKDVLNKNVLMCIQEVETHLI